MANYSVSDTNLTAVANAIRTKGGTSADLSFPDGFVSAISAIPTGGGGATLVSKSITVNGEYYPVDDDADGYSFVEVDVENPRYVSGTFTGETAGEAITVTIPYTGTGYPIACSIYPTAGVYKSGESIYSLAQKKAVMWYGFAKDEMNTTPTYNSSTPTENKVAVSTMYKNSDTDSTNTSGSFSKDAGIFTTSSAVGSSPAGVLRMSSATTASIMIATTDAYGFVPNVEYTYQMIYSS